MSGTIDFRDADFSHPIFVPLRPALEPLGERKEWPGLDELNDLAVRIGGRARTGSDRALRFVAPPREMPGYELLIHETGQVPTRARNWHDFFNALAWLSFPRSKATLNALHVAAIPRERGRRGPLRDLLTLLDEGGVLVAHADPSLPELVREFRWKDLFWGRRADVASGMRFVVLGHAVLEMALRPWPGVTCKALFFRVEPELLRAPAAELTETLDREAAQWLLTSAAGTPARSLPPLPIFGFPGWFPGNERAGFYDDTRYFRPFRRGAALVTDASRIG